MRIFSRVLLCLEAHLSYAGYCHYYFRPIWLLLSSLLLLLLLFRFSRFLYQTRSLYYFFNALSFSQTLRLVLNKCSLFKVAFDFFPRIVPHIKEIVFSIFLLNIRITVLQSFAQISRHAALAHV